MFHKHKWKEIARTYSESKIESLDRARATLFFEKLIHGVTTILWKCEECQRIRKEELLGKIITPNE
jgi:hypothetical protein